MFCCLCYYSCVIHLGPFILLYVHWFLNYSAQDPLTVNIIYEIFLFLYSIYNIYFNSIFKYLSQCGFDWVINWSLAFDIWRPLFWPAEKYSASQKCSTTKNKWSSYFALDQFHRFVTNNKTLFILFVFGSRIFRNYNILLCCNIIFRFNWFLFGWRWTFYQNYSEVDRKSQYQFIFVFLFLLAQGAKSVDFGS